MFFLFHLPIYFNLFLTPFFVLWFLRLTKELLGLKRLVSLLSILFIFLFPPLPLFFPLVFLLPGELHEESTLLQGQSTSRLDNVEEINIRCRLVVLGCKLVRGREEEGGWEGGRRRSGRGRERTNPEEKVCERLLSSQLGKCETWVVYLGPGSRGGTEGRRKGANCTHY